MYLRVNLLEPGPRLIKKRIYRAAVSQRLRNTALYYLRLCKYAFAQRRKRLTTLFSERTPSFCHAYLYYQQCCCKTENVKRHKEGDLKLNRQIN